MALLFIAFYSQLTMGLQTTRTLPASAARPARSIRARAATLDMDQGALPLPSDPPLRRRRFRLRARRVPQAPLHVPEPLALPEPLCLADAPALDAADLADVEPLAPPPSAPVELAAAAARIEGLEGVVVDVEVADAIAGTVEDAADAAVAVVDEAAAPAARAPFIDRHPMLAKSLSMGLTRAPAHGVGQF